MIKTMIEDIKIIINEIDDDDDDDNNDGDQDDEDDEDDDDRTMEEITNFKYTHGTAAAARMQFSIKSEPCIESKRHDARSERRRKHDPVALDSNIKINQNDRDANPTSGHLELNEPRRQQRDEQVLEQQNMVHEIGKMLKIIVNGTAVLQYVLIESLTPPQFYSTSPI